MKRGLTTNITTVVLICILNSILLDSIMAYASSQSVLAQAPNATNETISRSTSQPEVTMLEKSIVPAQKTTLTVNQTTLFVSPQVIQLQNITRNPNTPAIES